MKTMKTMKSLTLMLLCCVVVSCGKKEIVIKNSEGIKFTSYQEACSTGDFSSAHRYIDRMRAEYNSKGRRSQFSSWDIDTAEEYVFREEALFLMSQGSETAKQRIIYLLKQHKSDSNCDMLVELAIEYDDEDFVKTLTRHYNSSISSEMLRKIVEYFYIEKGDENLDFVTTLVNRYNKGNILLEAAIEKGDVALVNNLMQQIKGNLSIATLRNLSDFILSKDGTDKNQFNDYVCKHAEQTTTWNEAEKWIPILAKLKTENSSKVILNFLTRIPVRGEKVKPGLCDYSVAAMGTWGNEGLPLKQYNDWVVEYNNECDKILSLAINEGNKYLARMILSKYVDNVHATTGSRDFYVDGVRVDGSHGYIKYVPTDRNTARKKYDEAIKLGLL